MRRLLVLTLTMMAALAVTGQAQTAAPEATSHPASAAAQGTSDPQPKWGVFAGYAAIETNNHNFHFNPNVNISDLDYDEKGHGFEIGAVRNLNRYFGIVGLLDAHFSSNQFDNFVPKCSQPPCPAENLGINPSLFRFTAGPEVAFRNHTRVTPFADVLFGVAHSHATFRLSEAAGRFSSSEGENGFAANLAAGLEVRIVRQFSFRGSLDYGKAFVGSSALPSQLVDSVGFSAALLFRFH